MTYLEWVAFEQEPDLQINHGNGKENAKPFTASDYQNRMANIYSKLTQAEIDEREEAYNKNKH